MHCDQIDGGGEFARVFGIYLAENKIHQAHTNLLGEGEPTRRPHLQTYDCDTRNCPVRRQIVGPSPAIGNSSERVLSLSWRRLARQSLASHSRILQWNRLVGGPLRPLFSPAALLLVSASTQPPRQPIIYSGSLDATDSFGWLSIA